MFSLGIMMGLVTMLSWGIADFIQALLIKKLSSLKVFFIGGITGLVSSSLLYAVYFFLGGRITMDITNTAILFFSSLFVVFGTYNFMKAFDTGEVSIVAPISGTYSLVTVILSVVFLGEILSLVKVVSILLIVFGIIFVSTDLSKLKHIHTVKGLKEVLTAVFIWGIYFTIIGYVKTSYLASSQLADAQVQLAYDLFMLTNFFTAVFMLLLGLIMGAKISRKDFSSKKIILMFAANSVLYTLAWAALNIGLVSGMVSLVTPISSMYPAITVILAAIFLKERLALNQKLGVLVVLAGVVLISL
jgi:uncharacterized membrane protein